MQRGKNRPQLRRCAFCNKAGHNKATCPLFLTQKKSSRTPAELAQKNTQNTPSAKPMVKFFIHHTHTDPTNSPHVINLKNKKEDIWEKIQSVSPTKPENPAYHFYHATKNNRATVSAFANLPQQNFYSNKIIKKENEKNVPNIPPTVMPKLKSERKKTRTCHPSEWIKKTKRSLINALDDSFINFKNHLKSNFSLKRFAKISACTLAILIVPTQTNSYYHVLRHTADKISSDSTDGFVSLQDSTVSIMNANLPAAEESLTNALQKLGSAADTLQNKNGWLVNIATAIPFLRGQVESRQNLLLAGQKIALGNAYLLKGVSESQVETQKTMTERVAIIVAHLKSAVPNYEQAIKNLSTVKTESLPLEYQTTFKDFRLLFAAIVNDMQNMSDLGDIISEVFGGLGQRRYLLVFQNPSELRPTGGFMGSFAVLDIKDGEIINLEIPAGGSYDLQGQLTEYVQPPAPLLLSNKRWEFQDANWFPDFSTSAQKMLWFYRKSRNVTADGVIAINASVLERLLSIVGPVTDEKRELTITAENALPTIQQVVEEGPEKKENKPKQIIADLAPKFLENFKTIKPDDLLPLLTNLQAALNEKEIQAYFTDTKTENTIKSFGWGGHILTTRDLQDYLMVINTNIQGQKSDAKMKQTISHQAIVEEDGTILDSVVITREHTGTEEEKLYGQTNIDYIRIYVPEGSELVSAGGFSWPDENKFKAPETWVKQDQMLNEIEQNLKYDEASGTRITTEFNKTVFGNWIITEPGQISQVQFVYRLPFKATLQTNNSPTEQIKKIFNADSPAARYQLVVQRQSGCDSNFESQIIFPGGWTPKWKDRDDMLLASNGASIPAVPLKKDTVWSLIMTK